MGHESSHIGYVAHGLLSAAVCGDVLASPPPSHVSAAIEHLAHLQGPHGPSALVVIKNGTDDLLCFNFTVCQAREQGIRVESVVLAEDPTFGTENVTTCSGTPRCCLLYKVVGTAAAKGASLPELLGIAERVTRGMRSIGAPLSSRSLPGLHQSFANPYGVIHVDLDINGKKGRRRLAFTCAGGLAQAMVDVLLGQSVVSTYVVRVPFDTKLAVLVSHHGGSTKVEMSVTPKHVLEALNAAGMRVVAVSVGRHMTSLDMQVLSITVLSITDDKDLAFVLNTNGVQKSLMRFHVPSLSPAEAPGPKTALQVAMAESATRPIDAAMNPLCKATRRALEAMTRVEAFLTTLDAERGDGGLGSCVQRATYATLPTLSYLPWGEGINRFFGMMVKSFADACTSSSGPRYGALLIAGGKAGEHVLQRRGNGVEAFRAAIAAGSDAVQSISGVRPRDRTMVDSLEALPESQSMANAASMDELLQALVKESVEAAAMTVNPTANPCCDCYTRGKSVEKRDLGAELLVILAKALA